jgi:hypothetical protein
LFWPTTIGAGDWVHVARGDAVYYARQFMNAVCKRQLKSLGGPKGDPKTDEFVATVRGLIVPGCPRGANGSYRP